MQASPRKRIHGPGPGGTSVDRPHARIGAHEAATDPGGPSTESAERPRAAPGPDGERPRGAPRAAEATTIRSPLTPLGGLGADLQRLVAICCTLRSASAIELLGLMDAPAAEEARAAATALCALDRASRVAVLVRAMTGARPAPGELAALIGTFSPWLARLVLRQLPPGLCAALDAGPPGPRGVPHPRAVRLARRLLARAGVPA